MKKEGKDANILGVYYDLKTKIRVRMLEKFRNKN